MIQERKKMKDFHQDKTVKVYVNEDLTSKMAKLFSTVRSLQKRKHLKQTWTYNGNIKVTMPNGNIRTISNLADLQALVPDETLS